MKLGVEALKSRELMFELSHAERLKIIRILEKEPMRLSHLSKKLSITTAEVSRHLDRLGKVGLVEKKENKYQITTFTKPILVQLDGLDFLCQNNDYFLTHDLGVLPNEYLCLDIISRGKIVAGMLEVASRVKELSEDAHEFIYIMSDQVMRGLIKENLKKADEGVQIRAIYPKTEEIPAEYKKHKNIEIKLV